MPETGSGPVASRVNSAEALDLTTAALVAPAVDEDTWARAHAVFTDAEVANLIAVAGYYGMVCMTVSAYQIGASTDLPADR